MTDTNLSKEEIIKLYQKVTSPIIVKVETFDIATDAFVSEHKCRIAKKERQAWLINHLLWAVQNGKYVVVERVDDQK